MGDEIEKPKSRGAIAKSIKGELVAVEPKPIAPTTKEANPKPNRGAQALVVCIIGSIVAGFALKASGMAAVAVGALLMLLAFTRLDLFDYIKAPWLEVKLRRATQEAEEATKAAHEAAEEAKQMAEAAQAAARDAQMHTAALNAAFDVAQNTLRAAIAGLAQPLLNGLALEGRYGSGLSVAARLEIASKTEADLRAVGCDEEQIAASTRVLRSSVNFDLARVTINRARAAPKEGTAPLPDFLPNAAKVLGYVSRPGDSKAIRGFLAEYGVTDEGVHSALRRLEHFEATGEILPPDAPDAEEE